MPAKPVGTVGDLVGCVATTDAMLRALASVSSHAELALLMDGLCNELGFKHYALIHHDDLRGRPPNRVKLLSYPAEAEERIIELGTWRRDPVIRACAFSPHAFLWHDLPRIITLDRRDETCLEQGRKAGLNTGITVPFNLLGDCLGSCTFAGMRRPERCARLLGMVQMIGIFAFQAAHRLALKQPEPRPPPRLHPRPRDCVALAGRGLSNKEIARALSLTPRTVDGYLTEARVLFGVHDRTQLFARAMSAGEIGLHEAVPRQPE